MVNNATIAYSKLLLLISIKQVGNRGGRVEQNAVKRKNKKMPRLTKPRAIAKFGIKRNGA